MKIIESDKLLDTPLTLESTGSHAFGDRCLPIDTNTLIQMSDVHVEQLEVIMLAGLSTFGALEQTRALRTTGLPSLVARVDCTIDPDTGDIHPYEVEERPAGMGIIDSIDTAIVGNQVGAQIRNHFEDVLGELPVVKRHPDANVNDDELILPVEQMSLTAIKNKGRAILVRAEPQDMAKHPQINEAIEHAIAPILEKGKRQYRIATGFAQLITDKALLPKSSFVLKTLQGSKARGVKICLSKQDAARIGSRDSATRTQAANIIDTDGAALLERFVPSIPVHMEGVKMANMILRVLGVVGLDGVRIIGGAYMARPGHLVHGSKDAISGVVIARSQKR